MHTMARTMAEVYNNARDESRVDTGARRKGPRNFVRSRVSNRDGEAALGLAARCWVLVAGAGSGGRTSTDATAGRVADPSPGVSSRAGRAVVADRVRWQRPPVG